MKLTFWIAVAALCTGLAGCTGPNTGISTLQFNGDTVAFPEDYQADAAKILANTPGASNNSSLTISTPQPTLGVTALSPKRWYACVRGITPPGPRPTTWRPLVDVARTYLDPASNVGSYDAVVFYRGSGRPTVRFAWDAPLCRGGSYAPLETPTPL
ncbi:MAG: hypothetical protein ABWY10_05150 [Tardiphaga sp.]